MAKARVVEEAVVETTVETVKRRGNGRRDDYRKGGRSKDRFDKEKRYRKEQ